MMFDDKLKSRKVDRIILVDGTNYKIGDNEGFTDIGAIERNATPIWFNVWQGDFLYTRVNARAVREVRYKKK